MGMLEDALHSGWLLLAKHQGAFTTWKKQLVSRVRSQASGSCLQWRVSEITPRRSHI